MLSGISKVEIGGVDFTDKVTRATITETIGEPSVCRLETVINPVWENDIEPAPFSEVQVTDSDGNVIFGGRTNRQPQRTEEVSGARFSITASDWSSEASLRFVDDHYEGWFASDIYRALVEKYLPGHTTDSVQTNETILSLKFSGQTLSQCLKAVCDMTQWGWSVDGNRDHYFGPMFVDVLETLLTDDHVDTSKGATTRFEKDYSTLANRVWVEGGEAPSQRMTKQFVAISDLQATEKTDLGTAWPLQIPVWYKCRDIGVAAVFDSGDGTLENGKLVPVNCSVNANVGSVSISVPTDQTVGIDKVSTVTYGQGSGNFLPLTGQSSHAIIPEFDCMYLDDGSDNAKGGHVYISEGTVRVMERTNAQGFLTGDTGLGYYYSNPTLEKETTKMLGFLVTYRRLMKISYVSEVDAESVEKYGVQIDLPKVTKTAIKDWSVLVQYADFLLSSHKDPPSKGKVTLWRYKNGQRVFDRNLKAGWLISFVLERFGSASSVKVTKLTHEIEPHCWQMVAESCLDPNLYQTMFADILGRVAGLELELSTSSDVINSMRKVKDTYGINLSLTKVDTLTDDDYGFDASGFGASEWEG